MQVALGMRHIPIRPALQEFQVALVGIEGKPVTFTACPRDLLVGISNILEVKFPVLVGLVSQVLRLAGNGVDLSSCGADFLYDACI